MVLRPSLSALPFPGQVNPACSAVLSSHVLQPLVHLGGPWLYLLQFDSVPKLDAALQMWSHKCWIEGNNHFLDLLVIVLIKQPSMRLAFNAAKMHCWFMFSFSSRSPGFFFAKLLSSQLVSRLCQMQDLVFAFVEHLEVMYTFRYRCSFCTHSALLQIQLAACTCIHQVYRFIHTFCQVFFFFVYSLMVSREQ